MKPLAQALKGNKNIEMLIINSDKTTDKIIKPLVEALEKNSKIDSINIISQALNDESALAIADLLKVKKIRLETPRITDTGAQALADALKHNESLRTLSLTETNDAQVFFITKALK